MIVIRYNHVQWDEEYRVQKGYLRNCCEYPLVLRNQEQAGMIMEDPMVAGASQINKAGKRIVIRFCYDSTWCTYEE